MKQSVRIKICDPKTRMLIRSGVSPQSSAQGLTWFNTRVHRRGSQQQIYSPSEYGTLHSLGPRFFNWDASLYKGIVLSW